MKQLPILALTALLGSSFVLADSEISAPLTSGTNVGIRELVTEYPDSKNQDPSKPIVVGQSFTIPADSKDTVLTSVSFWLFAASGTPHLRAYIGEMSGTATDMEPRLLGGPLFASDPVEISWHSAQELTFKTGNLQLKPGKAYMAFITGISDLDNIPDKTYLLLAGKEVPDETNAIAAGRGLTSVPRTDPVQSVTDLFGEQSPYWNGEAKAGGGDFAFRAMFVTSNATTAGASSSSASSNTSNTQSNASTPANGGGGGCSTGNASSFDPMLLLLSGFSLIKIFHWKRNKKS